MEFDKENDDGSKNIEESKNSDSINDDNNNNEIKIIRMVCFL